MIWKLFSWRCFPLPFPHSSSPTCQLACYKCYPAKCLSLRQCRNTHSNKCLLLLMMKFCGRTIKQKYYQHHHILSLSISRCVKVGIFQFSHKLSVVLVCFKRDICILILKHSLQAITACLEKHKAIGNVQNGSTGWRVTLAVDVQLLCSRLYWRWKRRYGNQSVM